MKVGDILIVVNQRTGVLDDYPVVGTRVRVLRLDDHGQSVLVSIGANDADELPLVCWLRPSEVSPWVG